VTNPALARQLGDRHLHFGLDGFFERSDFGSVRIVASEAVCQTLGGQHLLWMLVNLLMRQFAVIQRLELYVPKVTAKVQAHLLAPQRAAELSSSLALLAHAIAGDAIDVAEVQQADSKVDVEILAGASPSENAGVAIGVWADGWLGFVGNPSSAPGTAPTSAYPFAPYYAACLASAEVFKRIRRMRPEAGAFADKTFFSLWSSSSSERVSALDPGPTLAAVKDAHAYLVGAGAVGQAFAAVLCSAQIAGIEITVVDHDVIDPEGTNLNRCVLAVMDDKGRSKSQLTCEALRAAGLPSTWSDSDWARFMR